MEKLELKHIAPYLEHELKVKHFKGLELIVTTRVSFPKRISIYNVLKHQINVNGNVVYKPILHPLSDLTKEIEHNGDKFYPWQNWDKFDIKIEEELINMAEFNYCDGLLPFNIQQKLIEWHFDVFGLIEKGLAIDINTLNK